MKIGLNTASRATINSVLNHLGEWVKNPISERSAPPRPPRQRPVAILPKGSFERRMTAWRLGPDGREWSFHYTKGWRSRRA